MKMKKKVLTTSLAASLIVGSVASLPVYAADSLPDTENITKAYSTLKAAFDKLTTTEKELLADAKTEIAKLEDVELINPIFDVIQAKIQADIEAEINPYDYEYINNKAKLFELVKTLAASSLEANYSTLLEIYANEDYRAIINELFILGEQEGLTTGDLEIIAGLFNNIEDAVKDEIEDKLTSASISDLKDIVPELQAIIVSKLLASETKPAAALKKINIKVNDIYDAKANIENALIEFNEKFGTIDQVLAKAYLSTLTYSSGGNNNNPGWGGGGIPADTSPKGPDAAKAAEAIGAVIDGLDSILADKSAGLVKAVAAVQEAFNQAAVIDLSKTVTITNGKAVPTLDANKLGDIFKTVKEIADAANAKLKEIAPEAASIKVIATLDLGEVAATEVEFPLTKEVLAKAKENGIEALGLKVNGVVLTIDLDQLGEDAVINIKELDDQVLPSANLTVASDVYEFSFVVDGRAKDSFTKPVEVRLPVSVSGFDQELLVFTKVDGDDLIFKGGKYDTDKKTFIVANKYFSTYTVLENNVSFSDIASVKDWAGRQITVAAAKGIIDGRAEGQYVPNDSVTRAEFAKLIVKAFGLENESATESFTDVAANAWYQPYVAAAAEAGLIEGRADGIFAPDATITRAELATIASRALAKVKSYKAVEETDAALAIFVDAADIHATLQDGVAFAAEQGLVVGEEGSRFNPNNPTTRAQAAVIIYRLLNK